MPIDISDLPPDGNPLNDQHLMDLNAAKEKIARARKALDLASRAGFDVTKSKAALDDMEGQVTRIKQVYFPNR